jgi:Fe-S cluster biogenesis protein NfuA
MLATMRETEIRKHLDRIRPAMQADGGDIDLVSVEDGTVSVRLRGTCLACPSASMTMKHGIERTLREKLPWVTSEVRVP